MDGRRKGPPAGPNTPPRPTRGPKPLGRAVAGMAAGNLVNRILGMVYRILLIRFLGAQGVGFLQVGMSFYFALLTPLVAGLTPAVARIVAGSADPGRKQIRRLIVQLAAAVCVVIGLTAGAGLALGGKIQAPTWVMVRDHLPMELLAPAILLGVMSSILRGWFLGIQRVIAVVTSQAAEQIFRNGVLIIMLLPGIPVAAMVMEVVGGLPFDIALGPALLHKLHIVLWNVLLGEVCSFLLLLWWYRRALAGLWVMGPPSAIPATGRAVAEVAVPVTIQRSVGSFARMLEAAAIPALLVTAGLAPETAFAAYGEVGGMAMPLIHMPTVLVFALTAVLLPAIAGEGESPRSVSAVRHRTRRGLALGAHTGGLTAVALFVAGDVMVRVLFGDVATQGAGYPQAGRIIISFAAVPYFFYVDAVATTVLRAVGKAQSPLLADLVSAGLRLGLLYALVPNPRFGVVGLAAAVTVGVAAGAAIVVMLAYRAAGLGASDLWPVLQPLAAAPLGAAAGRLFMGSRWAALAPGEPLTGALLGRSAGALALAAAVYGLVWLLFSIKPYLRSRWPSDGLRTS